jgi:hypothetical protein
MFSHLTSKQCCSRTCLSTGRCWYERRTSRLHRSSHFIRNKQTNFLSFSHVSRTFQTFMSKCDKSFFLLLETNLLISICFTISTIFFQFLLTFFKFLLKALLHLSVHVLCPFCVTILFYF